jgi:hypothetical protein
VHCHRNLGPVAFLDHAARNFCAGATACGLRPAVGVLLFSEMPEAGVFAGIGACERVGDWAIRPTGEAVSLIAERPGALPLVLVAGRQIVTREGLEILILGAPGPFAESVDLATGVAMGQAAGGLAVLPWGFGKWWGRRGRILDRFLATATPGTVFLGDNGGRFAGAGAPAQFALARRRCIPILPGSDPLPLPGDAHRAGSYGFALDGPLDSTRPAAALKARLLAMRDQPRGFGRLQPLWRFLANQVGMQWRKRMPGS